MFSCFLVEPAIKNPFAIQPILSIVVESFYELNLVEKMKIFCHVPVKWKILPDEKKSKKDSTYASTEADTEVKEEDMAPKGDNSKGKLVT